MCQNQAIFFDQVIIEPSKKKSDQKKELSKKDLVLYTRKRMQNHSFSLLILLLFFFFFFFVYNYFIQSLITKSQIHNPSKTFFCTWIKIVLNLYTLINGLIGLRFGASA